MNASSVPNNQSNPVATDPDIGDILAAFLVALLIFCTLITNCLVCVTFYLFKDLRTVCHYFVISLSAADILVAVVAMPFWCALQLTSMRWLFGESLRTFWNCMDILCGTASIMNLTAVSIDRHAAITEPFNYQSVMTSFRAISMIIFVWFYSIVVSGLRLAPWPTKTSYMHFVSATSFFIPLLIMIIMYTRIYLVARKQAHRMRNGRNYASDVKAAKTIAILIGLFVFCWGPFFAIVLSIAHDETVVVPHSLFNVIKWMGYCSSCLNPIIYSCLNRNYRRALRKLCQRVLKKREMVTETSSNTGVRPKARGSSFTVSTVDYDNNVGERNGGCRRNSLVLDSDTISDSQRVVETKW